MRENFIRHLNQVQEQVLVMAEMVRQAVSASLDCLERGDLALARRIYQNDQMINEKRYAIENEVITLIATQQPMASDLRLLAAVLEINTELERMGDYGKGIAHIALMIGQPPDPEQMAALRQMSGLGLEMLDRALQAFIDRDAQVARRIPQEDDQVDRLYNQFVHQQIQRMIRDPQEIDHCNYLTWAAHNLERLSDRVTNICERVVFVVTAQIIELDIQNNSGPSVDTSYA